jgi:hypothetical protein
MFGYARLRSGVLRPGQPPRLLRSYLSLKRRGEKHLPLLSEEGAAEGGGVVNRC